MKFREDLQCDVARLSYDFDNRRGQLHMEAAHSCDMGGCIALFEKIDPNVERITTIAGEIFDTIYVKTRTGWDARVPEER